MSEKYTPTPAELKKAKGMMSENQKMASLDREQTLEALKTDEGNFTTILVARKNGIPEADIKAFALRFIRADIRRGLGHEIGLRIAQNSRIMTDAEVAALARETYSQMLAENAADTEAAAFLYGEGSPEHQAALRLHYEQPVEQKRWKITKKDSRITLSDEATVADLFEALQSDAAAVEKNGQTLEEIFRLELQDNFNEDIISALEDLESRGAEKITVIDFFKKFDYTAKDISVYLPLSFRKKKK